MQAFEVRQPELAIVVEKVAHHRNGVSGMPFYVVCFRWADDGEEPRSMVGIVFEAEGHYAVLDREMTRRGDVAFAMGNSWRGDYFIGALREAIRQWNALTWEQQQ